MSGAGAAYIVFTVALVGVLLAVVRHYYRTGRRDEVEYPKHRMLEDDKETD